MDAASAIGSAQATVTIRPLSTNRVLKRDSLIAGTMSAGLLGIAAAASWYFGCPTAYTLTASVASLGLAKLCGAKDGIISVFTDYFPKALQLNRSLMKPAPQCGPTGIWQGAGRDVTWSQFFDFRLAATISRFLRTENLLSVWDFGCGSGSYVKELQKYGLNCKGLEGSPGLVELSDGMAEVQDLAIPFNKEKRDCVISLEVGAKIPELYADQFLENISAHAKNTVILSWPVKGQKGPLQLNRQDNDYVISKMEKLGWKLDENATLELRNGSHPIYYWFEDTIMVFRKKED